MAPNPYKPSEVTNSLDRPHGNGSLTRPAIWHVALSFMLGAFLFFMCSVCYSNGSLDPLWYLFSADGLLLIPYMCFFGFFCSLSQLIWRRHDVRPIFGFVGGAIYGSGTVFSEPLVRWFVQLSPVALSINFMELAYVGFGLMFGVFASIAIQTALVRLFRIHRIQKTGV